MLYIVDIHGEIEGDYEIISEYDPRKVYLPHVTNEYLKQFELKFDWNNINWEDNQDHNMLKLVSTIRWFNDLIQVKPLRTMNDLLDYLDMDRVENGFDMAFEKGDRLEWKAMEQPYGSLLITFNLSNN